MTRTTTDLDQPELLAVLERARALGFLGPGPLRAHLEHALRYHTAIDTIIAGRVSTPGTEPRLDVLDLGSGAGLPGLPLAWWLPQSHLALLDAGQRRCEFLRTAVTDLRLGDRVSVAEGRAEKLAHLVGMRARYDVVVSRGFGPPALTVECGIGFLKDGGVLLVSEPPARRPWTSLSLGGGELRYSPEYAGLAALTVVGDPAGARYPRSIKAMRREPLFSFE